MVGCEASTFPLVNLTKVSTAAHSTQCFGLYLFHGQKVTFWHLSFFNSKYLLALSKAGLISNPAPANSTSTVGGGDSPSYSGFSTVWQSLTTEVPRALTQAAVYCNMYGILPHGSLYPVLILVHPVQSPFACIFDLETF